MFFCLYFLEFNRIFRVYYQVNPSEDSALNDEAFLTKQIDAQTGLKKSLVVKLEAATLAFDAALKEKKEKDARDKVDAYNNWRMQEEKKGRAQDEHGKGLVKVMLDAVKAAPPNPVNSAMCNVMGNVDGNII